MILDLKPVKYNNAFNCLEYPLACVTSWKRGSYELMFADAWDFSFSPPDPENPNLVGTRILSNTNNNTTVDSLEHYYSIKLSYHKPLAYESIIEILKDEVAQGKPVIIYINDFWCPWFEYLYKHTYGDHWCLAVGLSEINSIYCYDSIPSDCPFVLPIDDFKNGCGPFVSFSFLDNSFRDPDWHEVMINAANRLFNSINSSNSFNAMREFSNELLLSFNPVTERQGNESFAQIPIISQLNKVYRARKQFAMTLNYFAQKDNNSDLFMILSNLNMVIERWGSMTGMLVKAFLISDYSAIISRVASKINDIAGREEKIANDLLAVAKNNSIRTILTSDNAKERVAYRNYETDKIEHIDISRYFNNMGIGYTLSSNCLADFNDRGYYYYMERFPQDGVFRVDTLSFKLSKQDNNDNISCIGQTIEVENIKSASIMVMGCSDSGTQFEDIVIRYSNGFSEKVQLHLSDWMSQPDWAIRQDNVEKLVWSGKGAIHDKTEAQLMPRPVHIYARYHILKHEDVIKGIELPYCPNIHIFAISLGYSYE